MCEDKVIIDVKPKGRWLPFQGIYVELREVYRGVEKFRICCTGKNLARWDKSVRIWKKERVTSNKISCRADMETEWLRREVTSVEV